MIPRENIKAGDRVKAYCLDVRREQRGQQIFFFQEHIQNLWKNYFIQEVPEIYDGLIEIKSSARDPGSRAKICVKGKRQFFRSSWSMCRYEGKQSSSSSK